MDTQDPSSGSPETAPVDPADQAVISGDQSAFKEIRLAQRTGKPVPTILPPAESAPAEPVEQAASTDALPKAASEPAKKRNAETRIQELLAERDRERSEVARLRSELEQHRPKDVKADPSPAKPSQREFERYKAMPDAPKVSDYDDYGDWNIDMAAFVNRKGLEEYTSKLKQDYDAGQHREMHGKFDAKGVEQFSDFREVLGAAGNAGRQWPDFVNRKLLTHEQGPAIAYALAQAKDDDALYQRITDPVEFGEYVAEFLAQQKTPRKPPTKTTAPDPPFTLGSQTHDSVDEEESALQSGDQTAFKAARLRRRAAQLQQR